MLYDAILIWICIPEKTKPNVRALDAIPGQKQERHSWSCYLSLDKQGSDALNEVKKDNQKEPTHFLATVIIKESTDHRCWEMPSAHQTVDNSLTRF
jgi:hypothetical protein